MESHLQIEKINQEKQIKKIKKKIENFSCPVCLDNFSNYSLVPCGHMFCGHCCNKLDNCPLCRVRINKKLKLILPYDDQNEENINDEDEEIL